MSVGGFPRRRLARPFAGLRLAAAAALANWTAWTRQAKANAFLAAFPPRRRPGTLAGCETAGVDITDRGSLMASKIPPPVDGIWLVQGIWNGREDRREFAFGKEKMLKALAKEIFQDEGRWQEVEATLPGLSWDQATDQWVKDADQE